ncbi:MAG: ABC transporter permease [Gammaproteobacteria bacterium]
MYAIFAITRFTLLEAFRNRLSWLFLILILIAIMFAEFMGGISITESHAIKTSLLGATLRIFAVFVSSLYVITSLVREINDKGLELTLSLPVSRSSYYFGKFFGYTLIVLAMTIVIGVCLLFYAPAPVVLIWTVSLFCELLIISALCMLCVYTFTQVTVAITVVAAFYLLARSIDAIQLMSRGPLIDPNSLVQVFMTKIVDLIAMVLPDLYRFNPSEWLIYFDTASDQIGSILIQTVIYLAVLIAAGLFDLYRKNL